MSDFHLFFHTLQAEIWEAGPSSTPTLKAMLACLAAAPMPNGIRRLPTARMAPGPHLAPQEAQTDEGAVWLEPDAALGLHVSDRHAHQS